MKKRILSGLLVLCMVIALSVPALADATEFPDVPANADYAEAVSVLSESGIITGDNNGYFNPDNTITRAETATIICRLMGVADEAKGMSTN